ncbi:hypothetical protein LIER_35436 [Lithospermum erythrorhizon]|uniref:Uncharacterized protein n=1 Tax=Lithospermum erythrorhizon TaxID=34254 RepID=A0AAV3NRU2_LITER
MGVPLSTFSHLKSFPLEETVETLGTPPSLLSSPKSITKKNPSPFFFNPGSYKVSFKSPCLRHSLISLLALPHIMSDSSNSRLEGQGYNSDARSFSSSQVSSSPDALAGSGSSVPLQATPLASRAPSSSRHPPQAKTVRVDLHRCCSELSERELVDLRSRYDIPTSVILRRPNATDRANAPPPGLRTFYVVALNNGLRLPRPQKDGFLYFTVRTEMKGFCKAFTSKVEPETWRPFFFYASGKGLLQCVPFGFMDHPKSHVLKATGLSPIADADPGALEVLRVSYSLPDHTPTPSSSVPATTPNQPPPSLYPLAARGEQFFGGGSSHESSLENLFPDSPPLLNHLLLLFSAELHAIGLASPLEERLRRVPRMLPRIPKAWGSIHLWAQREISRPPLLRAKARTLYAQPIKPRVMLLWTPADNIPPPLFWTRRTRVVLIWRLQSPTLHDSPCLHLGVLYLLERGCGLPLSVLGRHNP